jgi:hypothetical protein
VIELLGTAPLHTVVFIVFTPSLCVLGNGNSGEDAFTARGKLTVMALAPKGFVY